MSHIKHQKTSQFPMNISFIEIDFFKLYNRVLKQAVKTWFELWLIVVFVPIITTLKIDPEPLFGYFNGSI